MCRYNTKVFEGKGMTMFSAEEYTSCKKWIAQKIQEGYSWEDVEHLCVPENQAAQEFDYLQMEELVFPPNLEFSEWPELVNPFDPAIHQLQICTDSQEEHPIL